MTPSLSFSLDLDRGARVFGDHDVARAAPRGWDLLANTPVPLRSHVRDGVAELLTRQRAEGGRPLKCCFPAGQGGRGPFDRLRLIRKLEDFPEVLVSSEVGNVFNRRFHQRWVEAGAFGGCQPSRTAAVFADCGLVDPEGWIGVFAVAPFVWLIDRRRLGGLPTPGCWADLAEPIYRGQVVFSGWRRDGERQWSHYNKFFLLAMARELGLDGLARLMRNVPGLMHSAQMPRLAGTDASLGGIYVLPWSLADMCPRRAHTEVVWPRDGALAWPLWLTAKTGRREGLDPLIEHFHGPELAAYLNRNRYPALCPGLPAAVPEGARLKWLGWDFIRHRATPKATRNACTIFLEALDATDLRSCA